MIAFPDAYVLLLLLLIPGLVVWQLLQRRRKTLSLTISDRADALTWTWRRSTLWLPPTLRVLGLSALIVAAAKPFDWSDSGYFDSQGIAIELVVDRSGSMREDDFLLAGQRVSRLQAVVEAASRFIIGDPLLGSRHQDLVGLVTFARQADAVCPLTLDHEQVVARLEQLQTAVDYREDGTAIGDALGLAVAELESLDRSLHLRDPDSDLARVVVLLSDGEQNAGELTPDAAAQLARHYGIRVYVIGLAENTLTSGDPVPSDPEPQHQGMQAIAALTGGEYFSVSDTQTLQRIYQTIDALERAPLNQRRLMTRRQWAVEWFRLGPFGVPPIALVALVALTGEWVLQRTVYLRVV